MAAQVDPKTMNLQEQFAAIQRHMAEIEQRREEIRKMTFESDLHLAETRKLDAETKLFPVSLIFQAMIATGALLGAGAAVAKIFFP